MGYKKMSTERLLDILLLCSNIFLINHPLVTTSAAIVRPCSYPEVPDDFCSTTNDPHTLCIIVKALDLLICKIPNLNQAMELHHVPFPNFNATEYKDVAGLCDSSVMEQLRDTITSAETHELFVKEKCKDLCVDNKVCRSIQLSLQFYRNVTSAIQASAVDHKTSLNEIILSSEDLPAEPGNVFQKTNIKEENGNSSNLPSRPQNVTQAEDKKDLLKQQSVSAKTSTEGEISVPEDIDISIPSKETLTQPLQPNMKPTVDKRNDSIVSFTNLTSLSPSHIPVSVISPVVLEVTDPKSPLSSSTTGELTSAKNQILGSNSTVSLSVTSGSGNVESEAARLPSVPPKVQKPISLDTEKEADIPDAALDENDLYKEKGDKDVSDVDGIPGAGEAGLEEEDSPLQKPMESSLGKPKSPTKAHESSQSNHRYSNIPNHGDPYLTEISDDTDAGYFNYFITVMGFIFIGFILFHNKKRLIALIIEGRRPRGGAARRRRSSSGGNNGSTSYRKLENNFD